MLHLPARDGTLAAVHRVALALLVLLVALVALASLDWPFSWDGGIFAWVGDTIVHGGMPYRDAWDTKGPAPFYVFAAVQSILGPGMWGIRLVDLLIVGAGAGAAAVIVSRLAGRGAAAYSAAGIALQYLGTGYFDTAQPDGWAAVLLLLGLAPLIDDESRTSVGRAAVSALVLGLCLLIKPIYGVFAIVPAAYLLLRPGLPARDGARGMLAVVVAFALPALLTAGWFAVRGAWTSLVEGYLLFNFQQAGAPIPGLDTTLGGALSRFTRRVIHTPAVVLALVLAAAAVIGLWRERRRSLLILALATAAAFFTVFIQQRYWNRYQWHPPYMVLGALAGCGAGLLWRRHRALAAGLGSALLVAIALPPLEEALSWVEYRFGRTDRAAYERRFTFEALSWSIADARALAQYLRTHTGPDERVLVWSDPLVYYLSGRAGVSRIAFHIPVIGTTVTPLVERQRAELLGDLARYAPRYVAVGRRDLDVADSLNESNIAGRFPALYTTLRDGYVPVARFGERELLRRRDSAAE